MPFRMPVHVLFGKGRMRDLDVLFILGIDDKRVHGDFGPAGTLYGVPQQGTPEFMAWVHNCCPADLLLTPQTL